MRKWTVSWLVAWGLGCAGAAGPSGPGPLSGRWCDNDPEVGCYRFEGDIVVAEPVKTRHGTGKEMRGPFSIEGKKLFEAMAYGVPVLMSVPDGEATALLRAAGCGECLPPEDPRALAAALRRLQRDPERLAEYRARGLAAAPRYSRRTQAERLLGILEQVVG